MILHVIYFNAMVIYNINQPPAVTHLSRQAVLRSSQRPPTPRALIAGLRSIPCPIPAAPGAESGAGAEPGAEPGAETEPEPESHSVQPLTL